MNSISFIDLIFLPELFYLILDKLNDKEKIFLISCSKIASTFKASLTLNSEYYLEEINNKFYAKNIIIKNFSLESKIKELIKNLIPESIIVHSKYVKFISNNTNIKLFHNQETIEQIVSYEFDKKKDETDPRKHFYLSMKVLYNERTPIYECLNIEYYSFLLRYNK